MNLTPETIVSPRERACFILALSIALLVWLVLTVFTAGIGWIAMALLMLALWFSNGLLNPFATRHAGRHFIVIDSHVRVSDGATDWYGLFADDETARERARCSRAPASGKGNVAAS